MTADECPRNDTLDESYYLPMFALPSAFGAGVLMLAPDGWKRIGLRMAGATIAAAAPKAALTFVLIVAYSTTNAGWDLS